jgi:hypothetical protein
MFYLGFYKNKDCILLFYFEKVKKTIPKSKKGIKNWTFINVQEMSNFQNPKIVLKNTVFFTFSPYSSQLFFEVSQFCDDNFFGFLQKL